MHSGRSRRSIFGLTVFSPWRTGSPCRSARPVPFGRFSVRVGSILAFVAVSLLYLPRARAREPSFTPFDVRTVFYISKSDDRNRVDYGIHLDAGCVPSTDDAVFPYWREFENSPPVRIHTLGMFEYFPYGISEQRTVSKTPAGVVHVMTLRQFRKWPIRILIRKEADGHCEAHARTTILGKDAELTFVYVRLVRGGLAPSVDSVEMHGKAIDTGQEVLERLRR